MVKFIQDLHDLPSNMKRGLQWLLLLVLLIELNSSSKLVEY
jgi:hypothetical protein